MIYLTKFKIFGIFVKRFVNVLYIIQRQLSKRLNLVNDKFLIRKNENWHATFNLPKLTAIYLDIEEYCYDENNIYQNNGLDEVKGSLIITLKAYDQLDETIDLDGKYGVYFDLTNNYRIN